MSWVDCMSFDPILNQWTSLNPYLQQHIAGSAVAWKGQILICGGKRNNTADGKPEKETSLMENYYPENDTWTVLNSQENCGSNMYTW